MAKRIESPSSINTFKQCRRKYYYQYIKNLPTLSNIHQVRGNIAHSTLDDFYNIDPSAFNEDNYDTKLKEAIQKLLVHHWKKANSKIEELKLNQDQKRFYFEETMLMVMNWVNQFITDLNRTKKQKNISFQDAFQQLTPVRELEYRSDNYSVHGFIDAIHHLDEGVHLIDYKTNSSFEIKDSLRLQLAIYSLLYFEKHGEMPSRVGIFFLRHKLKLMKADQELLDLAKKEIELVHRHTSVTEEIEDYPQTVSALCRWSSGQCDFYGVCQKK